MTTVLTATCGRCDTQFNASIGDPLECPNPTCEAILLLVEGQLAWVLPGERGQLAPRQEQISLGGRENGRIAH